MESIERALKTIDQLISICKKYENICSDINSLVKNQEKMEQALLNQRRKQNENCCIAK